jgi:hypothetical protein
VQEVAHLGGMVREHIREGRFQRSLAVIAGLASVLSGLEVLTEHYRGSYSQRIMYSPIILSPALLVAGLWAALSKRAARTVLPVVSVLTILDGVVGFAFHVRGIKRKPGGWRIPIANLIMGPPVLAPLLFAISGYLGLIASLLRREGETINTEARRHGEDTGKETPALRPGRLLCSASVAFRPLVSLVSSRAALVFGRPAAQDDKCGPNSGDEGGLNPAARWANEPPRPKVRRFKRGGPPHACPARGNP